MSSCLRGILAATLLVVVAATPPAHAHSLGEGYIFLNVGLNTLDGQIQLTFEDLDRLFDLDTSGDGSVSQTEAAARLDDIQAYIKAGIAIGTETQNWPLTWTTHNFERYPEGQYLAQNYVINNPGPVPDVIRVSYKLLFETDPLHRGFLVLPVNAKSGRVDTGEETTLSFSPAQTEQVLDLTALSRWDSFVTFVKHGIWHIWIGIDHILFLVALILPAVLVRRNGIWEPVKDSGPAVWNVVKIVTLFTIAHTITLSLAALDVVRLPGRLVESVIAASVVIAALNNIYPLLREKLGWVVFGFGLFHGFGFASVLGNLVKNRSNMVVDLLGFNVGVEIGQIVIILLCFPLLNALRKTGFYRRVLLPTGSVIIALLALGWLTERMFDLELMPI